MELLTYPHAVGSDVGFALTLLQVLQAGGFLLTYHPFSINTYYCFRFTEVQVNSDNAVSVSESWLEVGPFTRPFLFRKRGSSFTVIGVPSSHGH